MKKDEWLKKKADGTLNVKANAKRDLAEKAMDYIRKNYRQKFRVEDAAQSLFVNKSYLMRTFKEKTGTTLLHALNTVRCDFAAALLASGDESIEMIAYSVGYATPSHFAKTFKSIYGVSPSDYRAKQKKKQ